MPTFYRRKKKLKKGQSFNDFLLENTLSPVDVISFNQKTKWVIFVDVK